MILLMNTILTFLFRGKIFQLVPWDALSKQPKCMFEKNNLLLSILLVGLIGILNSWLIRIPLKLGSCSSPTNPLNNQGPFFHCSNGSNGSKEQSDVWLAHEDCSWHHSPQPVPAFSYTSSPQPGSSRQSKGV